MCAIEVGSRLTTDWITIWTAFGAVSAFLALVAFAATAIIAWQQVDTMKRTSRAALTAEVLRTTWMPAVREFVALVNSTGLPLMNSKVYVDAEQQKREQGQKADDATSPAPYLEAYLILAMLYVTDAVDRELVLAFAREITLFYFYFGSHVQAAVNRSLYPRDEMQLARDAVQLCKDQGMGKTHPEFDLIFIA